MFVFYFLPLLFTANISNYILILSQWLKTLFTLRKFYQSLYNKEKNHIHETWSFYNESRASKEVNFLHCYLDSGGLHLKLLSNCTVNLA